MRPRALLALCCDMCCSEVAVMAEKVEIGAALDTIKLGQYTQSFIACGIDYEQDLVGIHKLRVPANEQSPYDLVMNIIPQHMFGHRNRFRQYYDSLQPPDDEEPSCKRHCRSPFPPPDSQHKSSSSSPLSHPPSQSVIHSPYLSCPQPSQPSSSHRACEQPACNAPQPCSPPPPHSSVSSPSILSLPSSAAPHDSSASRVTSPHCPSRRQAQPLVAEHGAAMASLLLQLDESPDQLASSPDISPPPSPPGISAPSPSPPADYGEVQCLDEEAARKRADDLAKVRKTLIDGERRDLFVRDRRDGKVDIYATHMA